MSDVDTTDRLVRCSRQGQRRTVASTSSTRPGGAERRPRRPPSRRVGAPAPPRRLRSCASTKRNHRRPVGHGEGDRRAVEELSMSTAPPVKPPARGRRRRRVGCGAARGQPVVLDHVRRADPRLVGAVSSSACPPTRHERSATLARCSRRRRTCCPRPARPPPAGRAGDRRPGRRPRPAATAPRADDNEVGAELTG